MSDVIVGIDLGTSNCVVAHCDDTGQVSTLSDQAGFKIHPSVVSFLPNGTVVVGAEAKQRKVIDPQNTIYSAKRLIGRSFRSSEVQMAKARMPYQIREGANQLPLIATRAGEFAIPEISAVLLDYVRNLGAAALGTEVHQAVITVPANFNDAQRTATATAGAIAGITVVRVLNEPTAAALAYGHNRELRQTIAVYDFGGGTFDITILRLDNQVYEVLGTAGDSFLGGDDLDERLVDRMVERFLAEQRIDLRSNEIAMMRLRAVAEQTKIELSRRSRAVVRIDEVAYGANGAPLHLRIEITRDEFVAMVADILMRTFPVCQEALKLAGLNVDGVDDIVLVGGTTKVPAVREQVAKFFARSPRNDINAEEAVAIGAALQADSLQRILSKAPLRMTASMPAPHVEETEGETDVGFAARADSDGAFTGQVPAPPSPVAFSPSGRIKRPTADLASRGRSFSDRPMTRGQSVDRYEGKESTGVPVGRLETARANSPTDVGMEARPPSPGAGRPLPSEARAAARPNLPADEEESTAARPPIDASWEDDTTSAVPAEVLREDTRASANPVASGRMPAPVRAATPPPLPPPLPPPARMSRPRIASPGPPHRESLPAIDPLPHAPPLRNSERVLDPYLDLPVHRPSGRASDWDVDDPLSAASTARGMNLPSDPQSTARGMVPELPHSLAGQPFPSPPSPSTTARGVAPASHTMMIGGGLASAGPASPAPPPSAPAPALSKGPPIASGPQARTMIAQTAEPERPVGLGPIPGSTFEGLPRASHGSGYQTPLPFAPPMVSRPGDASPFFPSPAHPGPVIQAPIPQQAMPARAPVVLDVTPFGLGIATVAGYCEALISRNTRVPTETRRVFATSRDGQTAVRIVVCQGEDRRLESNVILGELVLSELPPKPRGETSIEVWFAIDASGILQVRARDATTGREQRASLNVIGTVPEGDVAAARDRVKQLRR